MDDAAFMAGGGLDAGEEACAVFDDIEGKALSEDASTCLQPLFNVSYRHSSLGGYTERSQSDAALQVGDADVDAVTFGLGARLQSIVGTSVYNRATLLEGRVLFKLDAGDRDASTNSSFLGVNAKRSAKSAEMEACGVEVGAGLTIPVGEGGARCSWMYPATSAAGTPS